MNTVKLCGLGFKPRGKVFRNKSPDWLCEEALCRGEGALSEHGALVVKTGRHTGRAANDKFIVCDGSTENKIWWGNNQPMTPLHYKRLRCRVLTHLSQVKKNLFVFDGYASARPLHQLKVRVVAETAWHSLFSQNMLFVDVGKAECFEPGFTIYHAPTCDAIPEEDGTVSGTFIVINFNQREVLIGGSAYAGEIKKSVFTIMNWLLPERGILPMHCSANYGSNRDDAAIFFGLSGTGKTTLSADPERTLVGDDEHGWSDVEERMGERGGIFNFEAGCYAKVIRLSEKGEPEIYATTRMPGTVLENVVMEETTRIIDLDDDALAENTRASYPATFIPNMDRDGVCGHPRNIIFLTADAFGVLPPISRLTTSQAMYHYLSGYTAKVAGTEIGVTEPRATFSACFGAPFLPLHPHVYAELLGRLIGKYEPRIWLVNTGWTGGPYGVGKRMELSHTRRMLHAVLANELDSVGFSPDPVFGLDIPKNINGIPSEILIPRVSWADKASYDEKARRVAAMFAENFEQFRDRVSSGVCAAGPRVI